MKGKIFFRFFSVTLVAILLMFICGIIAVNIDANAIIKERLKEETELVCSLVKTQDDFDGLSKYENNDAFRITVIDLSGNVLFESDTTSPLENHGERKEIQNALKGSPVAVKRYSKTFNCNMTYYAMKTTLSNDTEIVVRLAVKNSYISNYLSVVLPIFIVVLVVALIVSLVVSGAFSKNISNKVSEIGTSLKSLNIGNYRPIKTDSSEPELFSVLSEINTLNEGVHRHIQEISEERNKLNTVLKNISQGIIAVDENKNIIFANDSAFAIFDYATNGNVKNKDLIYLIDDINLCKKITEHLNENYQTEYSYKGKYLSVAIKKAENSNEKERVFSIVIITDVTKERILQKQKNDFFANASHELKTPVTVTQGLSEILLNKDDLPSGDKKQVERIYSESVRLSSLISDMLKLSKLENGEYAEQVLTAVDLRKVASEVVAELTTEAEKKHIKTEFIGSGKITADSVKIYELIQNLYSNAVHYNKENGKIKIEISEGTNGVTLKVSDTGIGIEKEHLPRLCERFYRVDKSRSKKTGGTGLGLAIVKHICTLYNAKLSIDSEVDAGTTVSVVFSK